MLRCSLGPLSDVLNKQTTTMTTTHYCYYYFYRYHYYYFGPCISSHRRLYDLGLGRGGELRVHGISWRGQYGGGIVIIIVIATSARRDNLRTYLDTPTLKPSIGSCPDLGGSSDAFVEDSFGVASKRHHFGSGFNACVALLSCVSWGSRVVSGDTTFPVRV